MEGLIAQLGIVAGTLAACFAGPALAFLFLWRRKRKARADRRSPISRDLLRGPGHSLREQLDSQLLDVSFELGMLMVVPLLVLTVSLAQAHLIGVRSMLHLAPMYAVMAGGFIAWTVWRLTKVGAGLDNLKAGYDAEVAVGQELDQLMRQGAAVFHDIPAENFNIDHVVVSTQGVFAVETKGFTKPMRGRGKIDATVTFNGNELKFPTWTTREPLEQAKRQAVWLTKWIGSAVGRSVTHRARQRASVQRQGARRTLKRQGGTGLNDGTGSTSSPSIGTALPHRRAAICRRPQAFLMSRIK